MELPSAALFPFQRGISHGCTDQCNSADMLPYLHVHVADCLE